MQKASTTAIVSFVLLSFFAFQCQLVFSKVTGVEVDRDSLVPHKTSLYRLDGAEYTPAIVRRGLEFSFIVTLSKPLGDGEKINMSVVPPNKFLTTTGQQKQGSDTVYLMKFTTTPTTPVGQYKVMFSTESEGNSFWDNYVFILFNPYLEQDEVYYPHQDELSEYIENEYGTHWRGDAENHYPSRWYFAQFTFNSIQTAMFALFQAKKLDRSSAVEVARFFTYFLTIQNDNPNGLLAGRWTEPYSGGKQPTSWTGTNQITDQYIKTGHSTVKWAQCWVFGGALTTMLRTVGIPARQLFTFGSGHESPVRGHYSHVIENMYDENYQYIGSSGGSVWNFHSWNEMWLNSRPDNVPGWQAVDGTPQEQSNGYYRMGPAAVDAIKERKEQLPFDIPFVVSEVDATLVNNMYHCERPKQNCRYIRNLGNSTSGTLIVTPDLHSSEEVDITYNYKHKPSRLSDIGGPVLHINKRGLSHSYRLKADVSFPQVEFGKTIQCAIKLRNPSSSSNVEMKVEVFRVDHMGVELGLLKRFVSSVKLDESNNNIAVEVFEIEAQDYVKQLRDGSLMYHVVILSSNGDDIVFRRHVYVHAPRPSFVVREIPSGRQHKINSTSLSFPLRLSVDTTSLNVEVQMVNPLPFILPAGSLSMWLNSARWSNSLNGAEHLSSSHIPSGQLYSAKFSVFLSSSSTSSHHQHRRSKESVMVSLASEFFSTSAHIDLLV